MMPVTKSFTQGCNLSARASLLSWWTSSQILPITYSGSRPGRAQFKRRSKVRKVTLITLIAGLAVSVISPAFSQVNTGSISTIDQGTFNLAEAYPCAVGTYADGLGIA